MYLKGNSSRIDFFTQPSISIGGTVTSKYYDIFVVDDPDVQYVRHWSNGFDVNMSVPDARQFIVSNTDGTYAFGPGVSDGDIKLKLFLSLQQNFVIIRSRIRNYRIRRFCY